MEDNKKIFQNTLFDILPLFEDMIVASNLHQDAFKGFKNKHKLDSVVIVGAGPTLNQYKNKKLKKAIHVGLNRAFKYKEINFDYLFAIDKRGFPNYEMLKDFFKQKALKFVGEQNLLPESQIPENFIAASKNVKKYKTDVKKHKFYQHSTFALNIESQLLGNFDTVSLQAAQFVAYTNPSKIYLVGIDTTDGEHFINCEGEIVKETGIPLHQSVEYWRQFADFMKMFYPRTEVISINPVALKGIFKDEYM